MTALDKSISSFLLLHKDNLVAWRPWGEAALAEAKAAKKPIFLSIGYVGCHWCHVMNQECFNDADIAALINDNYIPILVDREERPDVDQIYQGAANLMGHNGGWPLNMFLMPDAVPYFAAGYLGKETTEGKTVLTGPLGQRIEHPSFKRILTDVIALYKERPEEATNTSIRVLDELKKIYERETQGSLDAIQIDTGALRIGQRFDIFMGGLTGSTKFPTYSLLEALWRAYLRTGMTQYLQVISTTMNSMLMGGLYDHVGGGFFRYTTDERWLVPHFEKSLCDNALLINFMTQMWQFNRNSLCHQRVSETIDWMLREMRLEGAFAGAVAADPQGGEGKSYVWTEAEIDAALHGTFSTRFKQVYGVRKEGDFYGKNILRRFADITPPTAADEALMAKQRALLLAARDKRNKPVRDDKLLADWNGLAIRALAFAGSVFDRKDWIDAAATAFDAIVKLMDADGVLHHIWANGKNGGQGFADDYAHMAEAALQLYESTGDKRYIDKARGWTDVLNDRFWDEARGGYYQTADNAEPAMIRIRTIFDQPAPSANGAMMAVLTKLALLTGENAYGMRAQNIAQAFAGEFTRNWISAGSYLNGFESFATGLQFVVVGKPDSNGTRELVRAIWGKALPDRLLVTVESTDALPNNHPAYGKPQANGQPTVYLCQRNVCSPPFTSAVALSQAINLPAQRQQAV